MESESLSIYVRMEDPWRAVMIRNNLGEIAEAMGHIDEARRYYEANLDHFSRMGDDRAQDYFRVLLQQMDERAGIAPHPAPSTGTHNEHPKVEPDIPVEPLSTREMEVLALLAEGLTNQEIAQRLYISPNTVRVHTYHIYDKLAVHNRTQASAKGRELGLLPTP
jgi:ATP/maltotriose-dependent transcriptional regulator MalT